MRLTVGQSVICVKEVESHKQRPMWLLSVPFRPVLGQRYTIREIEFYLRKDGSPVTSVLLNEIRNPIASFKQGRCEGAFDERNFEPLPPTETLTENRVEEDA